MSALTPLALFSLGGTEIVVILLIVMMLFGGEKLPELARGLGKAMRDFKKATAGVEEEIKRAMDEPPPRPKPPVPDAPVPPFVLPESTKPPGVMEAQILPPKESSETPDAPKPPSHPA